MQTVLVCGGRGSRLRPKRVGPKCLLRLGEMTLLERIWKLVGPLHTSRKPTVLIVDAGDDETPSVLRSLVPGVRVVRQPEPDGVASALLLADEFLDDRVLVALGDLFLDGSLGPVPTGPALVLYQGAGDDETTKNFGLITDENGTVSQVIEKPTRPHVGCGMGLYVLTNTIVSGFRDAPTDPNTGERGITDAISAATRCGTGFKVIQFQGYYNNINDEADIIAAQRYLSSRQSPYADATGRHRRYLPV